MDRTELAELHYITPVDNLMSILNYGILSHNDARNHTPASVANQSVQRVRSSKRIPGGKPLHDYANLYISARNAMLYQVLGFPSKPPSQHLSICVLGVDPAVLDLSGTVISDGNAAASLTSFYPSPAGLGKLNKDIVFGRYWKDDNPITETMRREAMMAEVLVPRGIPARYVKQSYVCCNAARQRVLGLRAGIALEVNRTLFFNDMERYHD